MTTLIYDDEPKWLSRFPDCPHAATLPDVLALIKAGGITEAIVNSRRMKDIPALAQAGAIIVLACGLPVDDLALRGWRAAGWADRVRGVVEKMRTDRQELEEGVRPLW